MNLFNSLQLTYIPSLYWNHHLSGFKVEVEGNNLPSDTSFFLVWMPLNISEKTLTELINYTFPTIPAEKLITCRIRLALPQGIIDPKDNHGRDKDFFGVIEVLGKIMPIPPAIRLLYRLEIINVSDRSQKYSDSIKTWAFLTKFIFELLNRGNFIPVLESTSDNEYRGKWKLTLKTQFDHKRFKTISNYSSWPTFNLPINFIPVNSGSKITHKTDGLWHKSYIFSEFMDRVGDYLIRSVLNKREFQAFNSIYSSEIRNEKDKDIILKWDYKFLKSLIKKDFNFKIQLFSETIIPNIIRDWVQIAQSFLISRGFSFVLKLSYPSDDSEEWPLNFYLASQDDNELIPIINILNGNQKVKKKVMKFIDKNEILIELIYRSLGTCSRIFPPISRALVERFPQNVLLSSSEIMQFLRYPKDLLIQTGFNVELPDVFTKGGNQRLTTRLVIHSKAKKKVKGTSAALPALFNMDSMLDFEWKASLEEKELTKEEFKEIITSEDPLINWRGKWVLVEAQDIEDLRIIFEKNEDSGTIKYIDGLKAGLTGTTQLQAKGNTYEVIVEGDLNEIIERLSSIDLVEIPLPKSFKGKLRPYQKEALTWLGNMCSLNFGVCLADDMGLGKTIQVIAFLLYRKEHFPKEPGSILIVCPTSVLFNWEREIKKFSPSLDIMFHHGPKRIKDASGLPELLKSHRVILTSYGTLRNDIEFLETINFSGIILDESQNIKNYTSKQTQAAYTLQGRYRICLSGTPIENRLMELWTLFEFLNPGLLDSRTNFQKEYILPIERFQDQDAIEDLKRIISPFIMRRVKNDKSIISDLPEKNEMKVYIELNSKQAKLYEEVVEKTLEEIKSVSSDNRKKKGLVLKLLTQLKQLCNHPNQFLKIDASTYDLKKNMKEFIAQSQKLERLIDMTDEVISNWDKVLIFTQFRKMGDYLKKLLEEKYKFKILYFHGGVPEKKRREIIDEFQSKEFDSPPILILSLKAGGTGLNLTRGTTVIHFDRWWNPAVENQATDRAYRIGQDSQVNVYKFITIGTIEEKIDALLEEKKDLAEKIVASSGESWISDLSEEKLKDLLSLKKNN
jgi:SNF2 family DNA or RNA helicase